MPSLYPHLHLLVPSSSSGTSLEVRLYIPTEAPSDIRSSPAFSTSSSSTPSLLEDEKAKSQISALLSETRVNRLISACHPWGKLGGSCLDPVIAHHLVRAASESGSGGPTAVLTWNIRGIGHSQGSSGLGLRSAQDEADLVALERWAPQILPNIRDLRRFGYSWGSVATLNAPRHPTVPVTSIFLCSPPLTLFGYTTWLFSSRTFNTALDSFLHPPISGVAADPSNVEIGHTDGARNAALASKKPREGRPITIAYGTSDDFTSVKVYRGLGEAYAGTPLTMKELDEGNHFYRSPEDGRWLEQVIKEWLET